MTTSEKKKAARAYQAQRRKDPLHRERQKVYMAQWLAKNAERKKESDRTYQQAHLAQIRINRKKWKSKKYAERIETLVKNHNGNCDICGGPPDGRWKKLNIDHCHITGKFRGLLCGRCNRGLGLFRDNVRALRLAAAYLKKRR